MSWNFNNEEDAQLYLEELNIQYHFGCLKENKPQACDLLGDYLSTIKKDNAQACARYKQNCEEHKFPLSCYKFGKFALFGIGCEKDLKRAYEAFDIACKEGRFEACRYQAHMAYKGTERHPKNVRRASELLHRCCVEGQKAGCCLDAAGLYEVGDEQSEMSRDMRRFVEYSAKACDLLERAGCVNASLAYRKGDGVPKNEELARHYEKKAREIDRMLSNPIQYTG